MDATTESHQALVDRLKTAGTLTDPDVEAAFRAVPRHLFLPAVPLEQVYQDEAIVTKRLDAIGVSSSSQPSIMAVMLQQLAVEPGNRVLEIGAGTGYNAALLARLVGRAGAVVTVDIDAEVAEQAERHLVAAGFDSVEVITGDGSLAYGASAAYDRIIVTVGAWDIVPAWWEQLDAAGRLVLPLALRGAEVQRSIAFDWAEDHLESASVRPCGFMLQRGAFSGPVQQVRLAPQSGVRLFREHADEVDTVKLAGWLQAPGRRLATGLGANPFAIASGLNPWLAVHDDRFCAIRAEPGADDADVLPALFWNMHGSSAVGILSDRGLALVTWKAGQAPDLATTNWSPDAPLCEIEIQLFGDDFQLAEPLRDLVLGWQAAGRPDSSRLRVTAYRRGAESFAIPGVHVISKRWSTLAVEWT